MRITHGMLAETTLRNLNTNVERLDKLQNELTSGQRISKPSDDPIGAAASVEFRTSLNELDQHIKNIDAAISWLGASDSALDSVSRILQRARELAVQGANDTLSAANRQAMAAEVDTLLSQVVEVGNSTYAGQHIFGGFSVNTIPFTPVGNPPTSVTYNGDNGIIQRQVDTQALVTVNVPGNPVFGSVFTELIGLRDDLNSSNAAAVSARIASLDACLDTVLASRSEVGARVNRLDGQKDRLDALKVNISELLSKTQDVDMTEAITEFSLQQNVYKAALAAGAKAIQPSLLDFLT